MLTPIVAKHLVTCEVTTQLKLINFNLLNILAHRQLGLEYKEAWLSIMKLPPPFDNLYNYLLKEGLPYTFQLALPRTKSLNAYLRFFLSSELKYICLKSRNQYGAQCPFQFCSTCKEGNEY